MVSPPRALDVKPSLPPQLSKADLLTFWFSNFGPYLVEVQRLTF